MLTVDRSVKVADEVKEGKVVFTIGSHLGDDRLVWDPADPQQVKDAIAKFDELMEKGHIAYIIKRDGTQGRVLTKTSWQKLSTRQAGEILFKEPQEVCALPAVVGG